MPSHDITDTSEIRNNNGTVENNNFSSIREEKASYIKTYNDASIVTIDQSNITATTSIVLNKFITSSASTYISSLLPPKVPVINLNASKNGTDMNGCQDLQELKRIG